jgi:ABC-2 type transport system ATP-binding protein
MKTHENNGIEVRGLVKQFKKGPKAVDGIDLDVAPGEIYGFLGPNGAGKSTTVNMLVTLLPPTAGRALVAGWDIATQGPQVRKAIGAALQAVALDNFLTGREHLKLIASLQGIAGAAADARASQLLARVGLEEAADRKVGGYSGGMKRRLDLALALVHEPRVLFLDEPTTGLDPQSRTALWEEVRRLAREDGVTVFLTTQYLEEADVLADRVGIINRGTIVAEGTPAELKAEIGAPTVEVVPEQDSDREAIASVLSQFGDDAAPLAPGAVAVRLRGGAETASLVTIVRAVDEAGLSVHELRRHEPTLDDVFLAKTGRTLEGAATEGAPDADADAAPRTPATEHVDAEPVA